MNCRVCGSAVVGRYCSYCGARVRTDSDEYNSLLRRTKAEYKRECSFYRGEGRRSAAIDHLATACWLAAEMRYGTQWTCASTFVMTPADIDNIEAVKEHAMLLFRQLVAF